MKNYTELYVELHYIYENNFELSVP